jgi:hypothetical protein
MGREKMPQIEREEFNEQLTPAEERLFDGPLSSSLAE